jgi:hypothetical protein
VAFRVLSFPFFKSLNSFVAFLLGIFKAIVSEFRRLSGDNSGSIVLFVSIFLMIVVFNFSSIIPYVFPLSSQISLVFPLSFLM